MSNYSYHLSQDSEGLQAVPQANYPEYVDSSPQPPVWMSKPGGSPGMDSTVTAVPPVTTASTIWGIPRRTFIVAVIIAIGIIIAGALGGGLGGGLSSSASSSSSTPTHTVTVTATASTCAATSSSTSSSSSSSSDSYSDCPDSNDTTYNSKKFSAGHNGAVPKGARDGFIFTKNCGSDFTGDNLAQASVATFDDCIDLCASYNFWNGTTYCKAASYRVEDSQCWAIGGKLTEKKGDGVDAAVLND